jgi:hypothetical protein
LTAREGIRIDVRSEYAPDVLPMVTPFLLDDHRIDAERFRRGLIFRAKLRRVRALFELEL